MLRSLDTLIGSVIRASDGDLGKLRDFLIDDRTWSVRYLVVETGTWFSSQGVLISPSAARQPDWEQRIVPVSLSMEQVRLSPSVDAAQPVSRLEEIAMSQYYGWPSYWSMEPPLMPPLSASRPAKHDANGHLRSEREIRTYQIHAKDMEIGSMNDMIMDDCTWGVRYLVANTGNWLSGQKILLSTRMVESILWSGRRIELMEAHDQL